MDGINWRNTLLSWATKAASIEKPVKTLEHINLNDFFEIFKENMADSVELYGDVSQFLKDYYPEFEPHYDETGAITVPDYMYLYSLFLHFACVRFKERFFQEKCCALNEKCQGSVASFLELLVKNEKFDRTSIRNAIHSSNSGKELRRSFMHLMSTPVGTPVRGSPPTPVAQILDAQSYEMKNLKAQLESEKYERGYLEDKLQRYEERVNKMSKEQKQHLVLIQELKNELLSRETENFSPNRNLKEETVRNRLNKQIRDLNVQVHDYMDMIQDLQEEKESLNGKLTVTQKDFKQSENRIKDLELAVAEFQEDTQLKSDLIKSLEAQVMELELHIQQSRDEHPREVLDSSNDLLELFPNIPVNAFSSKPESLSGVIDLKLKESERENSELKKKIVQYNIEFADMISKVLEKHGEAATLDDKVTLEEHLGALVESYEEVQSSLSTARSDIEDLKFQLEEQQVANSENAEMNLQLQKTLDWTKAEFEDLKGRYQGVVEKNEELTIAQAGLREQIDILTAALASSKADSNTVSLQLEESRKLCEETRQKLVETETKFETLQVEHAETSSQKDDLQKLHEILNEDYSKLSQDYEKLKSKTAALAKEGQKIAEKAKMYKEKLVENEKVGENMAADLKNLRESIDMMEVATHEQQTKLDQMEKQEAVLREQNRELQDKMNAQTQKMETLEEERDLLLEKIAASEMEFEEKGLESERLNAKVAELETQIIVLKETVERVERALAPVEAKIIEMKEAHETELQEATKTLESVKSEFKQEKKVLEARLNETQQSLEASKTASDDLKEQLLKAQEALKEASQLKREKEALETRLNETQQSLQTSKAASDELKNQLSKALDALKEASELKNEKEVLVARLNETQQSLEASKAVTDDLKEQLLKAQDTLMEDLETWKTEKEAQEKALESLAQEKANLEAQISEKDASLEKIREDIELISQKLAEAEVAHEKEMEDLRVSLTSKSEESVQQQLLQLKSSHSVVLEKLNQEHEEVVRSHKKTHAEEISALEQNIVAIKDEHQKNIEQLRVEHANQLRELEELKVNDINVLNEESVALKNEIRELRASCLEIRKEQEGIQETIQQKYIEIEARLAEKVAAHEHEKAEMIASHAKEGQLLHEEIAIVNQKIKDLEASHSSQLEGLKVDKSQVETELMEAKSQLESLKADKDRVETELSEAKSQLELEIQKSQGLEKTIEVQKAEMAALSESVKVLESESGSGAEKLADALSQTEKLREENKALEAAITEISDEKAQLIASLDRVLSDNKVLAEENEAINGSNQKVVEKIEQLSKERSSYQKSLVKLAEALKEAKEGVQELKRDAEEAFARGRQELEAQLEPFRAAVEERIAGLVAQCDKKGEIITTLSLSNEFLQREVDQKTTQELQNSLDRIDSLTERLRRAHEEAESKASEAKLLSDRVDEMQAELTKKEGEHNLLEAQLQKTSEAQKNLETKYKEATSHLEGASKKIQEKEKEIELLKEGRVQSNIALNELEMRVSSLSTENETLVLIADKLKEDNQAMEQQITEQAEEIEALRTSWEALESEVQKTKEQLGESQSTVTSLSSQVTLLQTQQAELQGKYEAAKEATSNRLELERIEMQLKASDAKKSEDNARIMELLQLNEKYKEEMAKTSELRAELQQQRDLVNKLKGDISIFQGKLMKHRQQSEEEKRATGIEIGELKSKLESCDKSAEEKLAELHTVYEQKLEALKDKARQCVADELAKKEKVLNELKEQNEKLKENQSKMAKHLAQMNQSNLDLKKENTFLQWKTKESFGGSSRDVARRQSSQFMDHRKLSTDDEIGEMFSETCLADLKLGRMVNCVDSELEFGRKTLPLDEICRRNSMMPQHLRGSYFFDTMGSKITEDEIRLGAKINPFETTPEHDDSGSSLLSSRNDSKESKKIAGKLAYHKPGPPTPSKNAGRVSLGKDDFPPPLSLKEEKKKGGPKPWSSSRVKDETSASPRKSLGQGLASFFGRSVKSKY